MAANKPMPPAPPPLPGSLAELLANRKDESNRTLNDEVETVVKALYDADDETRERFRKYCTAVYDIQAVEGSLSIDGALAAQMVRDMAKKMNIVMVVEEKLAAIARAMNVVDRRYKQSRKQRRNMLGGVIVPDEDGNDN